VIIYVSIKQKGVAYKLLGAQIVSTILSGLS